MGRLNHWFATFMWYHLLFHLLRYLTHQSILSTLIFLLLRLVCIFLHFHQKGVVEGGWGVNRRHVFHCVDLLRRIHRIGIILLLSLHLDAPLRVLVRFETFLGRHTTPSIDWIIGERLDGGHINRISSLWKLDWTFNVWGEWEGPEWGLNLVWVVIFPVWRSIHHWLLKSWQLVNISYFFPRLLKLSLNDYLSCNIS